MSIDRRAPENSSLPDRYGDAYRDDDHDDRAGWRFFNSSLASVIVGGVIGLVAVVGIAVFTGQSSANPEPTVQPDNAVVGGVEYGSRT